MDEPGFNEQSEINAYAELQEMRRDQVQYDVDRVVPAFDMSLINEAIDAEDDPQVKEAMLLSLHSGADDERNRFLDTQVDKHLALDRIGREVKEKERIAAKLKYEQDKPNREAAEEQKIKDAIEERERDLSKLINDIRRIKRTEDKKSQEKLDELLDELQNYIDNGEESIDRKYFEHLYTIRTRGNIFSRENLAAFDNIIYDEPEEEELESGSDDGYVYSDDE